MNLSAAAISIGSSVRAYAAEPDPSRANERTRYEGARLPKKAPPASDDGEGTTGEALEVVVTGTRTKESRARPPVRTDRVTAAEARRRGATNVAEALSGEVGVQVNPSAYGSLGNPSAIQIQGFDRERVLVLEDGERVIGDRGGAIDLSQFSLSDVSSIEVVAGPSSSLYGTSAIGGVVNIRSAPPEQEGWSGTIGVEGRSRFGIWTYGTAAVRDGNDWATVDGSFRRSQEVVLEGLAPNTAVPEVKQWSVGTRLGTRLSPDVDVMVRLRYGLDRHEGLEQQTTPGVGDFLINLPETSHRFSVRAVETIRVGEGSTVTMSIGRQWFENRSDRDRQDSPIDDRRHRSHTLTSFETTVTAWEGEPLTPVLGVRAETERFEQNLQRTELLGGDVKTTPTQEVSPTRLGSGAVYGQLRWQPAPEVIILPGVRGEAHTEFGAVAVPRLALSVAPSQTLQFRAAGGRGFRAPSAKEVGFAFDHSALGYRVNGSDDLRPETSWGATGDVTVTPTRGLRMRAGAFANWIEDLIDVQVSDTQTSGSGVTDYDYVNVGRARTFGYQLDAQYRVTPRFRAEVGVAYLWTRNDELETPLSGRPPYTLTAGLQAPLPANFDFYCRYRGVSDAFISEDLRTPPFSTLDMRLSRALWSRAEAYGGVINAMGITKEAGRVADQRPFEGPVFYLGIRAGFPLDDDGFHSAPQ